jgi:hypothetical protein
MQVCYLLMLHHLTKLGMYLTHHELESLVIITTIIVFIIIIMI